MRVVDEKTWYQVKFEGYKKLSWEPEEHLDTCKDIIDNFLIEEKVILFIATDQFNFGANPPWTKFIRIQEMNISLRLTHFFNKSKILKKHFILFAL